MQHKPQKIDLRELDRDQLHALVRHLNELPHVMLATNNTLQTKLAALPDLPPEALDIMADWSGFVNTALEKSHEQITTILHPSSGKPN
ncbi:MAG: hypothetical protein AAF441_18120 [Pseudomonadota bacterium]